MGHSDTQKYLCALREVGFRQQVYPSLIKRGVMSKEQAAFQISVMSEIAQDYRRRDEPELFEGEGAPKKEARDV